MTKRSAGAYKSRASWPVPTTEASTLTPRSSVAGGAIRFATRFSAPA